MYIVRKTLSDTLFYVVTTFLILAKLFDVSHSIDSIVNIIISILGRFRGGAAYVALLGSTFMGALSGSGAGNVATTGGFTKQKVLSVDIEKTIDIAKTNVY